MPIENSFRACEEIVRRADPDRYLSALFVPAEHRPLIFALYAFNHELARVAETVRDPMMGEIRLAWWRESLMEACDGRPRAHDVVRALAELFARCRLPIEPFETMIDARQFDVSTELFADISSIVTYADMTSGSLMRIASQILDDDGVDGNTSHEAGVAYGLAGILRTIPYRAAHRKLFIPVDVLAQHGIAADDALAGKVDRQQLNRAVAALANVAKSHHASARAKAISARSLPALLPAALVPLYLKRLTKPGFDPLHNLVDVPAYRKQLAFLRAVFRGTI